MLLAERTGSADAVVIGSARGATASLETAMASFLTGERLNPQTSPSTTAGSISALVARHIGAKSGALSLSMTCGSGLQAVIYGCNLRKASGMDVLCGGVEAPLTPFTRAQFDALRLLAHHEAAFPCKPMALEGNRVVLAEGGGTLLLADEGKFAIVGWGEAMSVDGSAVTFSGDAMRKAMSGALAMAGLQKVDVVVPHAPGTQLGDRLEVEAIRAVTRDSIVYSSKWATGHALGASGLLGIATGILFLEGGQFYDPLKSATLTSAPAETVMINSAGFGGNCASVILTKVR
jgi:3-oxoacyl-(acyl-carrier-protein) synthase